MHKDHLFKIKRYRDENGQNQSLLMGLNPPAAHLQHLVVSEGITEIGNEAFSGCEYLVDVHFPVSLKKIGLFAFDRCYQLKNLFIPFSVEEILDGAFDNCVNLENIKVDNLNSSYSDVDGVLYSKNIDTIIRFPPAKAIKNYKIPLNTAKIANGAFHVCKLLECIEMHDGIMEIGEEAFYYCENLRHILIPNGVSEIRSSTFSGCKRMEEFHIPISVTQIGQSSFHGTSIKKIVIPSSVKLIGLDAFAECKHLIKVEIQGNPIINREAFSHCDALTNNLLILPH